MDVVIFSELKVPFVSGFYYMILKY